MPTLPSALTRELGSPGQPLPGGGTDPYETTTELVWPLNLAVYDRMRKTDSQQRAISSSIKLPPRRTGWRIPAVPDVAPAVRAFVEAELGLRTDDQGRRRARPGGVNFDEFLRHALLHLDFGHMAFEQVYAPGPAETEGLSGTVGHLAKLAPRMPRTFAGIDVAPDGGLVGIRQFVARGGQTVEVPIPVERLVMFANEREGSDWMGQSIYRSSYKHWLIKDAMLRLSAIAFDRLGVGLPVVTYPADAGPGAKAKALKLAREVRSGEDSGAALEEGWTLELLGIGAKAMDPLPLINYHDRAASRGSLTMFLDLGHDNGARALGDTFVDVLLMAEGALISYLEEVITEHVIRDLVRINFGPDEAYPPIVADELTADSAPTAEALVALEGAGLIVVDGPLRSDIRRRYKLPPEDPTTAVANPTVQPPNPADVPAPGGPGAPGPSGNPGPVPVSGALPGTPGIAPQGVVVPVAASAGVPELAARLERAGSMLAALAAGDHPPAYLAESDRIRVARGTPAARAPHPFKAAEWTHPNGHPRCALCGCEERTGGCAGADHDGLTTSSPGSAGVAHVAASA